MAERFSIHISGKGDVTAVSYTHLLGRTAFDDVGDEDVFIAAEMDGAKVLVQQLAGTAHKGKPLLVFVLARRLPDEQHLRLRVAHAEHHVLSLIHI